MNPGDIDLSAGMDNSFWIQFQTDFLQFDGLCKRMGGPEIEFVRCLTWNDLRQIWILSPNNRTNENNHVNLWMANWSVALLSLQDLRITIMTNLKIFAVRLKPSFESQMFNTHVTTQFLRKTRELRTYFAAAAINFSEIFDQSPSLNESTGKPTIQKWDLEKVFLVLSIFLHRFWDDEVLKMVCARDDANSSQNWGKSDCDFQRCQSFSNHDRWFTQLW
jgi:hypothetical protein